MDSEVKQHFIQASAARGILRTSEAIDILNLICHKYEIEAPEGSSFKKLIATLNEDLNQYDHNIVFLKYPITKEEFLVYSTVSSKNITHINHLSEQDLCYFQHLLTTISASENYGIPEISAINLTLQMKDKPLSKSRAETLLDGWKQIGYFIEFKDVLYLGPRTVVEFESFLLNEFPDEIKECTLCKKLVLWDSACNECKMKFHAECIRKYLIKSSNCPACHKLWTAPANPIRYST